jgi:hypothetical protein
MTTTNETVPKGWETGIERRAVHLAATVYGEMMGHSRWGRDLDRALRGEELIPDMIVDLFHLAAEFGLDEAHVMAAIEDSRRLEREAAEDEANGIE